jgi:hypothetical protein
MDEVWTWCPWCGFCQWFEWVFADEFKCKKCQNEMTITRQSKVKQHPEIYTKGE